MTMVTLIRAAENANSGLSGEIVHDALWAFAAPEYGLEHARVRLQGERVRVVLFCRAADASAARAAAVAACAQACRLSPSLRGWTVDLTVNGDKHDDRDD